MDTYDSGDKETNGGREREGSTSVECAPKVARASAGPPTQRCAAAACDLHRWKDSARAEVVEASSEASSPVVVDRGAPPRHATSTTGEGSAIAEVVERVGRVGLIVARSVIVSGRGRTLLVACSRRMGVVTRPIVVSPQLVIVVVVGVVGWILQILVEVRAVVLASVLRARMVGLVERVPLAQGAPSTSTTLFPNASFLLAIGVITACWPSL